MARTTSSKGRPTGVFVKQDPKKLYYVKNGQVYEVPRSTGGKRGRKSCWPRDYTFANIPRKTGRPTRHPLHGTTIVKTAPSEKTVREMEKKSPRRAQVSEAEYRTMVREAERRSSVSEAEYRAMERAKHRPGGISAEEFALLKRTHRRTTGRK